MSRKLRPLSYSDLDRLPTGCGSCAFWESAGERERRCGAVCDADLVRDWYRRVNDEWGACGRVAFEDDEVLGFITSAPADLSVPLIACLHISPDARHRGLGGVLIRAALKDLASRGERRVEAFATAHHPAVLDESPMLTLDFLLRTGFVVSQADPRYPLLRLDLKSLAMLTENLESVLESLKFPLRVPKRAPASWMNGR
jgi:GNAT superfamily N-acetyltransferase